MTRVDDRQKAIDLRSEGFTYSEIIKKLSVPKGTLSGWLSKYPLTKQQLVKLEKRIKRNKYLGIEKTIIAKYKKRKLRLNEVYKQERKKLIPLTKRELHLCGLFLYWGEGNKNLKSAISLNNTDPEVIQFYYQWLRRALKIPKEKIKVALQLYSDMDISKSIDYWRKLLDVRIEQFIKPYIKQSLRTGLNHKGFGFGTCGLYTHNQKLKERIMLGIKAIANSISEKNPGKLFQI